MFYIIKGELYLSATARMYPEAKAVEMANVVSPSKMRDIFKYCRFQHIKQDNEDYWMMPPLERSRHILRKMHLFGCSESSTDKQLDEVRVKIEGEKVVAEFISLLRKTLLTDKGRIIEDMRRKIEILREQYMSEEDHEAQQTIFKSLTQAQSFYEKMNAQDGDEVVAGVEYLFELPENVKPFSLKI